MSVIHKSHWPSVGAIPELSLAEFICSNPFAVPDERVIVIEGGGTGRLTYKNYTDSIRNVAAGIRLVLPELSSGDVVCVLSPNTLTYPSLILGISGAGCVPAMVNPSATPQELAHSCKSLITFKLVAPNGLKALFCHPSLMDGALEGLKLTGFTKQPRLLSMIAEGSRGLPTVEEVTEAGRLNPRPLAKLTGPAESTLAMLFYSSGTTGAYKGVMLSHQNLIANAMQIIRTNVSQFLPTETMQSFLPLYHIYGTCLAILACAIAGTPTVHLHKFDLELFLSSIQEHKTTQVFIVPPVAVALAKHPIVDKYDLSSLKIISIAAAPTKLDLVQQLRRRLKVKVVQGYGMTEASPGTHQLTPDHEHHDGSVGQLYPDMECRLVNDDGVDVGDEEEGEIVLRGPNIMLGYIGNAEATADTVRDGWLHTGDIGRRSKDGFYWIVDRKKELIKVRGLQVAPADLESILLASPLVLDCAVTATYDEEKATELPRAFVVVEAKNRNDETIKALHALVDGQVAYYKRIAGGIFFLDEIPKNPSGKILRRLLPRDIGTNVKAKL